MSPDDFRRLALALPDAVEGSHQGHADFRVAGRIFATLGYPDAGSAVVMLAPEEQGLVVEQAAGAAEPVKGAWGAKGSTRLDLAAIEETAAAGALRMAWRRRASVGPVSRKRR